MKTKLFFLLLTCIFYVGVFGQTNHIITENADGVWKVSDADIDGDGDMDILSSSWYDSKIAWHENMDGSDASWTEHIITDQADGAASAYSADFDDDGDTDVLSASVDDDTIAWHENMDGSGTLWAEHIITAKADGPWVAFPVDFDGDEDVDVLSASRNDDTVAWFENIDGQGTSWTEHIITEKAVQVFSVYPADINNDGYKDVLSGSIDDGDLAWYENIGGQGTFGPQQLITTSPTGTFAVCAGDLDGDGDEDVLAAIGVTATLTWFENMDGHGDFEEHILELDAGCGSSISVVDIDNDGDMDILTTELFNDTVNYYENDGNQNFTKHLITWGLGPASAIATNINDDGSIDVVSCWNEVDKVVWSEDFILSVEENTLLDFTVHPNPTTGMLTVKSKTSITEIEIYNQLGQLVVTNSNQNDVDISSVGQGFYFIKIIDENGNTAIKKVIKK